MRIAIVADRDHATEALHQALLGRPENPVIWFASNAEEALSSCARDMPDLLLMSLGTTDTGGVEATRQIMLARPCAIVIVALDLDRQSGSVFEAMGQGALDVVVFTGEDAQLQVQTELLLAKIDTIARLIGAPRQHGAARRIATPKLSRQLVAIGASAGGPSALAKLLGGLPAAFPAAIVIVQHVDAEFAQSMAEWLGQHTALPVRLAREGDNPIVSSVLLAGSSDHLVFDATDRLGYTAKPVDYVFRPSVDVLFQSIARYWQGNAVGVLLTGMGRDGALGLKAMRNNGCHTIAQDRQSSAVYGMPKAAAQLDAAVEILSLRDIAPRLLQLCGASRDAWRLRGINR